MNAVLACGQFIPIPGDRKANLGIMEQQMADASEIGANIVVFPELSITGYLTPDEIRPLAVRIEGPEIDVLRKAAKRLAIDVAFGFAELGSKGNLYNSMAYLDSRGRTLSIYHKVHLWEGEERWARPGEGFAAFDTTHLRCGMWICYDTRFPEQARLLAMDGVRCALVASAWLGPSDEWELAVRARAMDNGITVAASTLQGKHRNFVFNGASIIVDPHGRMLAQAEEGKNEVIAARYSAEETRSYRRRLPLLRHRRVDLYAPLLERSDWK